MRRWSRWDRKRAASVSLMLMGAAFVLLDGKGGMYGLTSEVRRGDRRHLSETASRSRPGNGSRRPVPQGLSRDPSEFPEQNLTSL